MGRQILSEIFWGEISERGFGKILRCVFVGGTPNLVCMSFNREFMHKPFVSKWILLSRSLVPLDTRL